MSRSVLVCILPSRLPTPAILILLPSPIRDPFSPAVKGIFVHSRILLPNKKHEIFRRALISAARRAGFFLSGRSSWVDTCKPDPEAGENGMKHAQRYFESMWVPFKSHINMFGCGACGCMLPYYARAIVLQILFPAVYFVRVCWWSRSGRVTGSFSMSSTWPHPRQVFFLFSPLEDAFIEP